MPNTLKWFHAETIKDAERIVFSWKIQQFNSFTRDGEAVKSPEFEAAGILFCYGDNSTQFQDYCESWILGCSYPIAHFNIGYTWVIWAYPRGANENCRGHVSLFLDAQMGKTNNKVEARFMFYVSGISNPDGNEAPVKTNNADKPLKPWVTKIFDKDVKGGWGFAKGLALETLQTHLVNGDLYLKCYLEVLSVCTDVAHKDSTDSIIPKDESLVENLCNFWQEDNALRDVTLVVEGSEIKAHKSILAGMFLLVC